MKSVEILLTLRLSSFITDEEHTHTHKMHRGNLETWESINCFDMNNRTIFLITEEPIINSKYHITQDKQNM